MLLVLLLGGVQTGRSISPDCDVQRKSGTQACAAYRGCLQEAEMLLPHLHAGITLPALHRALLCVLAGLQRLHRAARGSR